MNFKIKNNMTFSALILAGAFSLSACNQQAPATAVNPTNAEKKATHPLASTTVPAAFAHDIFNGILQRNVSGEGVVNYVGLKKEEGKLDEYLAELAKKTPDNNWTKNASLAYWINAYNAFTIKLILKNYPVKSIEDINKGKPWDLKWIKLGNETYTLNAIENEIIRPTYKDARIHFAVNCAAKSCPPLANKAFTESNLNELLDARAKNFINSKANEISADKVTISKIFDWYKEDFGNVITFLNKYATTQIKPGASIGYKNYDWSLNGK